MKRALTFLFALLFLTTAGCTTTRVNLSATNPTDIAQSARVIVRDDPSSLSGAELPLGTVAPKGGTATATFKVKHGGTIEVQGLYKGGVVYDSSQRYVGARPDPLNVNYSLDMGPAVYLDESKSLQNITDAFRKIGVPLMAEPTSLTGAVNTLFGALLVVDPGDSRHDPVVYQTITPAELGVKQVDLASALALVPDLQETSAVDITKTTAAAFSVGFPFAAVGASFSDADIYQLSWQLSGFGYIPKPEDPDKSYITQYALLDDAHKNAIDASLAAHPGAKLIYVNRLYVIKTATITVTKGVKVSASGDIKAAVVTTNGAYGFDQKTSDSKVISNIVLNFSGDEVDSVLVYAPAKTADQTTKRFLRMHPHVQFLVMPADIKGVRILRPTEKRFVFPASLVLRKLQ